MSEDWVWSVPRDTSVFTLRQILDEGAPVLHVSHNSQDGAWQFLGWETPSLSDGVVACIEHLIDLDPSLDPLHDLPRGWHAWRPTREAPWTREPNPHDLD